MKTKKTKSASNKKKLIIYIAAGIVTLGIVFGLSWHVDMHNCERNLNSKIEFLKEQSASYLKYNDIAIAKGLVREATAARSLTDVAADVSEAELKEYADELWLTGITVLDSQGNLICEYIEDGIGYEQLKSDTKLESLLAVISYPQKTYVQRVDLTDGSYADLAAHSCADESCVILAYRHTKEEFSKKAILSVQTPLDGYDVDAVGTILIVEGNRVEASNDTEQIGKDVSENKIIQTIRSSNHSGKLISVTEGMQRFYGLYSRGRDYSFYAYMPAGQVNNITVFSVAIAAIAYILVVVLIQRLRLNSEKKLRLEKEEAEHAYKESLEQKNAELEAAIKNEAEANRAKREFLFNMTHDIRTPMNAIIGFTSLARQHISEQSRVEEYLKKIYDSSQHLLSIINDILDMSRIESGSVKLDEKPVHLPDLVENIENIIRVGAENKHISFTVDTTGAKDEDVMADALRLNQILINILSNSVKFTPEGGVISLRVLQKDGAPYGFADFEFHIKDNGIGMSKDFQKHIFEQFARERTSTVSKTQGTGLGMAITKNFVDMMGGTIELESEQGKGTEFIVSLRFATVEKAAEKKDCTVQKADFSGKKILVVEDNELNLEISATILREAGFDVDTAESGKAALEKVEQAPAGRYDLILMDIQMPEMDGYETTRRIRALADKEKAEIPIVATPANAFDEVRKKVLDAGMNAHIPKPLDVQKLFEVMQELLK